MSNQEIERKFLVNELPENLNQYSSKDIIQGYIAIGTDGTEVRLRKKGEKYFQTVKSNGDKIRFETEIEITKGQFDSLWKITQSKRLEKTRYEIPLENRVIELDIYLGNLAGLVSAEVEFSNEEESNNFTPPKWFGQEITGEKGYKNQSLALYGLPDVRK